MFYRVRLQKNLGYREGTIMLYCDRMARKTGSPNNFKSPP